MLLLTSVLLLAAGAIFLATRCGWLGCGKSTVDLDAYRKDGWFGKSVPAGKPVPKDDEKIRPFRLNISDADLQDLKTRLSKARYVDHIAGTHFNYGFNSDYLKKVVEYWQTTYNWRKEEAKINAYPQFQTQIEGLDIHFVHVKPAAKAAKVILPLLAVHGWPGSFWEYHKALPLLTEPDENGIAFEVIVPSIPGYGYSEAPKQKGFDASAAARVFNKLMKRLGHEKFIVHGGDWGYLVSRMLSVIFPENTIGVHLVGNMMGKPASACQGLKAFLAATAPSLLFGAEDAQREYSKMFPLGKKLGFMLEETGYFHIQATKPDTVAAGLVDSPVGLAAYILEKFSTWTNPQYRNEENGALTKKF
ncbi:PREDICTED: epoxide hydrolase 1-like, partial [Rhagoletis zephyria]|uniref:epoxide hydrolase 1-like n=1 Tax=Rhagoletis zephyria TaxID=28612 RepID=UPI000811692E